MPAKIKDGVASLGAALPRCDFDKIDAKSPYAVRLQRLATTVLTSDGRLAVDRLGSQFKPSRVTMARLSRSGLRSLCTSLPAGTAPYLESVYAKSPGAAIAILGVLIEQFHSRLESLSFAVCKYEGRSHITAASSMAKYELSRSSVPSDFELWASQFGFDFTRLAYHEHRWLCQFVCHSVKIPVDEGMSIQPAIGIYYVRPAKLQLFIGFVQTGENLFGCYHRRVVRRQSAVELMGQFHGCDQDMTGKLISAAGRLRGRYGPAAMTDISRKINAPQGLPQLLITSQQIYADL